MRLERVDLTGQRFGKLVVIKKAQEKRGTYRCFWLCKCDCGKDKVARAYELVHDVTAHCGCSPRWERRPRRTNWSGYEEISGKYLHILRYCARSRNLVWEVTPEYIWTLFLQQNRTCALTGEPLIFVRNYSKDGGNQNASLDRIDSSIGYVEGNVQWVTKWVNLFKLDTEQREFIKRCKIIVEHDKIKNQEIGAANAV